MSYKIGEREDLTPLARGRGKLYDDIIKAVRKKEVGAYPLTIDGMTPKQIHAAFSNKLKKDKTLRPRMRGNKVYLEVVKKEKKELE